MIPQSFDPFIAGAGAGCMSAVTMQPVDFVKVRLQTLQGTSISDKNAKKGTVVSVIKNVMKNEGIGGFYSRISAVLLRQVIYKGSVLGFYDVFLDLGKNTYGRFYASPGDISDKKASTTTPAPVIVGAVLSAGTIAGAIGNPTDVAVIRMQTDTMLEKSKRRNYAGVVDALVRIYKEEGFFGGKDKFTKQGGLMSGWPTTCGRAVALNLGMLGGSTVVRDKLNSVRGDIVAKNSKNSKSKIDVPFYLDTKAIAVQASLAGAVLSTITSLPFDYVKTQLQGGHSNLNTASGSILKQISSVMSTTIRTKGILGFYVGYPVHFAKQAPMAFLTLTFQGWIKAGLARIRNME